MLSFYQIFISLMRVVFNFACWASGGLIGYSPRNNLVATGYSPSWPIM